MFEGYIKLHRKLQDSNLWFTHRRGKLREASLLEAWIDMLFLAYYKPGRVSIHHRSYDVARGQFITSYRFLAKRWGWKVRRTFEYIRELVRVRQIGTEPIGKQTRITVVNYNRYNPQRNSPESQIGTSTERQRNSAGTVPEQSINKVKESKEGQEAAVASLLQNNTTDMAMLCSLYRQHTKWQGKLEWLANDLNGLIVSGAHWTDVSDAIVEIGETGMEPRKFVKLFWPWQRRRESDARQRAEMVAREAPGSDTPVDWPPHIQAALDVKRRREGRA